jgi:hypothetical protein
MRPPSGLAGSRLPQDVVDALLFEQRNRKFAGEYDKQHPPEAYQSFRGM